MLREPCQAKLICGIIAPQDVLPDAEEVLIDEFGDIDGRSATFAFDFTQYYEREMGKGLLRRWVGFRDLIPQQDIRRMKLVAMQLEKGLAREDGSRRANLDPGYLTPSKLVLTTAKDYSHRVYLGEGIFAEVTLVYMGGRFRPLDWTYPDYRREDALEFFEGMRDSLKESLSKWACGRHD